MKPELVGMNADETPYRQDLYQPYQNSILILKCAFVPESRRHWSTASGDCFSDRYICITKSILTVFVERWNRFCTIQNRLRRRYVNKAPTWLHTCCILDAKALSYNPDNQQIRQLEGGIRDHATSWSNNYPIAKTLLTYVFCSVPITVLEKYISAWLILNKSNWHRRIQHITPAFSSA